MQWELEKEGYSVSCKTKVEITEDIYCNRKRPRADLAICNSTPFSNIAHQKDQQIPIILLSGHKPQDLGHLNHLDFIPLHKPFVPVQLNALIKRINGL